MSERAYEGLIAEWADRPTITRHSHKEQIEGIEALVETLADAVATNETMTRLANHRASLLQGVVEAWKVPGKYADYHYEQMERLRVNWPVLHAAIIKIVGSDG